MSGWSENTKVDEAPMFRGFDQHIAQNWTDKSRAFAMPFSCFKENEKIVLEAVMDYANDRGYLITVSVLSDEACRNLRIVRGPENTVVYNAILTVKK